MAMARRRLGIGIALLLAALAWAWWDGGRESLRPIEEPVPLPANSLAEGVE